jgi:hypothetical protein
MKKWIEDVILWSLPSLHMWMPDIQHSHKNITPNKVPMYILSHPTSCLTGHWSSKQSRISEVSLVPPRSISKALSLGDREVHPVLYFPLVSSGASPMQSSPQFQAESPVLTEATSLLIRALTKHGGFGATHLPGGSTLLWVDQDMVLLLYLIHGEAPCPHVSCPRYSFRSQDLAWWKPHKTLSLTCTVWILLKGP